MVFVTFLGTLSISCLQASDRASKIKSKVARVQEYAGQLAAAGLDPGPVVEELQAVKGALDSKDADRAERLLDAILARRKKIVGSFTARPQAPGHEPVIEVFSAVEPVEIDGYSGTAMEPLISYDGEYLFFNDSNGPDAVSKIHLAVRRGSKSQGKSVFDYLGKLSGTASNAKDMAPAMDRANRFYFTSLREYERSRKSLFVGNFLGGPGGPGGQRKPRVAEVRAVTGNISSTIPGWLNMDCDVTGDGKLFCYSRARFKPGGHVPEDSDLYLANIAGGDGSIFARSDSDRMLARVNTQDLEYAPCFGRNGMDLYFTRAYLGTGASGRGKAIDVRIMIASRKSLAEPFGEPARIMHIEGLVEGPSLSGDGQSLFFHKKVGAKYRIFRAFARKS